MKYLFNKISNLVSGTWFDLYIKHFKLVTIISTILLFCTVLLLAAFSHQRLREVVLDDFNKQQLVLAKYIASTIENSIDFIKRELVLLSVSQAVQNVNIDFLQTRMNITFTSISDLGVIEIRFLQNRIPQKAFVINKDGFKASLALVSEQTYLAWASNRENKEKFLISNVEPLSNNGKEKLVMNISSPVWRGSGHPEEFIGVLVFVINTTQLVENLAKKIELLKDSYLWIINNGGIFLYHPKEEFIGKNAFEARGAKFPKISFTRINEIQKEKMLKGETGTSWYLSGWHLKEEAGQIKKLVAYTPIRLDEQNRELIWSVAIASPAGEVESIIDRVQITQYLLEGFFVIMILVCGSFLMALMLKMSHSLKNEVEIKTRELRKSEYQYKSLIENANDIIFTATWDGVINSINKAGCSFFNMKVDELIGKNFTEFCSNEQTVHLLSKLIREVFDFGVNRKTTISLEVVDNEYWLNINFSLLLDEDNKPYAVLGIARDITSEKIKEKEEQMYQAEKLASMGTLAAGVAHEINNPLAIILGFTDLLLEQTPPESGAYNMLKTIEKHALTAKKVVEGLLSFARFPEQKEELCDIKQNIETVLQVVKNLLTLNNIQLVTEFQENLPSVKGDPDKLRQVFLNIINNAIHAMKQEEKKVLTVKTRQLDNDFVEIQFCDTGHGIKHEYRNRIFDPLFTTKKVGEGTGLGLSVCYGIVTQMGGKIAFETRTKKESRKPGTTFIITLPVAR